LYIGGFMATASMRNCIFVCYNETCENCFPTKKEEPKKPTKAEIEHRRKIIAAAIKHAKSLNW